MANRSGGWRNITFGKIAAGRSASRTISPVSSWTGSLMYTRTPCGKGLSTSRKNTFLALRGTTPGSVVWSPCRWFSRKACFPFGGSPSIELRQRSSSTDLAPDVIFSPAQRQKPKGPKIPRTLAGPRHTGSLRQAGERTPRHALQSLPVILSYRRGSPGSFPGNRVPALAVVSRIPWRGQDQHLALPDRAEHGHLGSPQATRPDHSPRTGSAAGRMAGISISRGKGRAGT